MPASAPRPDAPGPLKRRGPRPLLLHLTLAMLPSAASPGKSPNWSGGWPSWNGTGEPADPATLLAALAASAAGPPPLDQLARSPWADAELIAGIAAYRRHPWVRSLADPPTLWSEGDSRLLEYGGDGPVVLFVPSLVNRAHVLDLDEGRSMLRWLAGQGVHPLLLDWGWPGPEERRFTLTDYVAGRLERALAATAALAGGPVVLVGYCMGGLLALAAALRRPDLVRALAVLATPWDFHADDPAPARRLAALLPLLEPLLGFADTLPVDALQMLFALLDLGGIARKYRAFAQLDPQDARARLFVALEDWLNDGVPLAAPVARECLEGWYGRNTPGAGQWRIAGLPMRAEALARPAFVAVPGRDRIVPPASALPLARLIQGASLHRPGAGHIGMVAGAGAELQLWRPLRDWIAALAPVG